jgi:serine phosphatase RsbU (regulator of sigma subunit)
MIRGGLQDRFVTLAAMVLDPVAHQLTVVNAGHIPPKLFSAGRGILTDAVSTEATGLPLGIDPGFTYEAVTLSLEPGDCITVFTDGVTDAQNPTEQPFTQEAAEQYLHPDGPKAEYTPTRTVDRLIAEVRRHANGRAQNDDIAIVCFGRLEPGHGPVTSVNRAVPATPIKLPL